MSFKKILVVCAGNICRSPIGAAFFKEKLIDNDYVIDSAGIVGLIGHPADKKALKVMQEVDIDISNHQGQRLNEKLIADYELILVMTKQQVTEVTDRWPFSKGRVFRIGHWLDIDIPDPYKKEESMFMQSRDDLKKTVDSWIEKIN